VQLNVSEKNYSEWVRGSLKVTSDLPLSFKTIRRRVEAMVEESLPMREIPLISGNISYQDTWKAFSPINIVSLWMADLDLSSAIYEKSKKFPSLFAHALIRGASTAYEWQDRVFETSQRCYRGPETGSAWYTAIEKSFPYWKNIFQENPESGSYVCITERII
jgi:hypothetical protein